MPALLLLFTLLGGLLCRADMPAAPAPVTTVGEFWNIPDSQRQVAHALRLELVVHYYDPAWRLLWGESAGVGCFLPTTGRALRVKAGQRVRLEGTVIPAAGITGDSVTVTLLEEEALPKPLSTKGGLAEAARLDAQWVTSDGYICDQQEVDPTHVLLQVLSEGRLVNARLLLADGEPVPQLLNTRVRIEYVYVAGRDPTGLVRQIDGWVPHRRAITVLGSLRLDPNFSRSVTTIDRIGAESDGEVVHLAGEVRAFEPHKSVTVRDATGQMVIRTEQPLNAAPGDFVDVVGRVSGQGIETTLLDPVCRLVSRGAAAVDAGSGEALVKLRLADQVVELRPDEAAQHFPVVIRGAVTWSDAKAGFFFVQDSSGGVRVQAGGKIEPPAVGRLVSITGVSTTGGFAPELDLQELRVLGNSLLPAATPVTLDEALTGAAEAQRVEMRGYLRQVEHTGTWHRLNLTTVSGEFSAYVSPDPSFDALVGAMVKIVGVCTAVTNAQRQQTGVRVWLENASAVQVEQARPADPFAAPLRSIGSLRQYLAFRMLDRQVKLSGVVLYNRPGRFLYLQQEDSGILVLHRDSMVLNPGEWVEVVGIPGRAANRLVLREAVWRRAPRGADPKPLVIGNPDTVDLDADGRLATVRARLQDSFVQNEDRRLMLRGNDTQFEARLDTSPSLELPAPGSLLELTGVYVVEFDEYRWPRGFRLQMRSIADIRVLKPASWWTAPRALAIAGACAVCALLGIGWVVVLRRRVERQTAQIRQQLEKETRLNAELERATRLESLGVLAGGIAHDFNNLLTVIMANIGLATMDDGVRRAAGDVLADAERGARRAAELTQQLLTFAKGGDPVRSAVVLPEVVREAAEHARRGSQVQCEFEIEPSLPPAHVDRGQISRVVHNLVLNAVQAMSGGVVTVRLSAVQVGAGDDPQLKAGPYIKLTVADNGPGIAPEHLGRIFEPYFSTKPSNAGLGLAMAHSIVRKHQGAIRVRSEVGVGTTFDVWLPVSAEQPVRRVPAVKPRAAARSLRVLFMDDEETIRRAAEAVLKQLGHVPTVVADGGDAVREYEEAMRAGEPYDVVVLDLTVPGGIGGRAAIGVLRRMDPGVRAIVSSGYSQDPVLANHQEYGFLAVVPKPYEISQLAAAIQQVAESEPLPPPVDPLLV